MAATPGGRIELSFDASLLQAIAGSSVNTLAIPSSSCCARAAIIYHVGADVSRFWSRDLPVRAI